MAPDDVPAPWEAGRDGDGALRDDAIRIAVHLADIAQAGGGGTGRPRAFLVGIGGSGIVMRR